MRRESSIASRSRAGARKRVPERKSEVGRSEAEMAREKGRRWRGKRERGIGGRKTEIAEAGVRGAPTREVVKVLTKRSIRFACTLTRPRLCGLHIVVHRRSCRCPLDSQVGRRGVERAAETAVPATISDVALSFQLGCFEANAGFRRRGLGSIPRVWV